MVGIKRNLDLVLTNGDIINFDSGIVKTIEWYLDKYKGCIE